MGSYVLMGPSMSDDRNQVKALEARVLRLERYVDYLRGVLEVLPVSHSHSPNAFLDLIPYDDFTPE